MLVNFQKHMFLKTDPDKDGFPGKVPHGFNLQAFITIYDLVCLSKDLSNLEKKKKKAMNSIK